MKLHFSKPDKQINDTFDNQSMIAFSHSDLKIAVQKKGHLHLVSKEIVRREFEIDFTELQTEKSRRIVATKQAGDISVGFYFCRNKSILDLVAGGSVNIGVIGIDQVFERKKRDNLLILKSYKESYFWKMVIATPINSEITTMDQIKTIATQYPKITQNFLGEIGMGSVEIIPTAGSTEAMAYTTWENKNVDAVVDTLVSGNTMKENGMVVWNPPITATYPVLIINHQSAANPKIRQIVEQLNSAKTLDFESLTSLF
ncbi:MAG: ATP phosphoribosyltransferase [Patescibacteria group bacterium]